MSDTSQYYYVTTPIYYVNDKPHIGHAYTTILADVLARYHRLRGVRTRFLTGTDEHGQKVARAAERNGFEPLDHCTATMQRFLDLWQKLAITNDDFIRTTEARHKDVVRRVLQDLYDRDEIYKADYEGSYCTPCERFYTDKDLQDGACPECGRTVEQITESNYFFKMSSRQDWLIRYIEEHPDFVQPAHRRNETLGFLRKPLGDLCISRPKSRLSWGIELPFDSDYVCYVWFDALINYISGIRYTTDAEYFDAWWPTSCHLIGKDILTTHSVYWPIMLKAMGVSMPQTIFAHGWWLVGRDKMGKSLGNVVDPMAMCDRYGVDAFRYFLMAEMTPGNDASFTEQAFIERYNNDLAGGLGNMLNRAVKLIRRHCDNAVPTPGPATADDTTLREQTLAAIDAMEQALISMKLDRGIEAVNGVVRACNRYFEKSAPWTLAKCGDHDRLATVLYHAAESLRVVSGLLYPIMPAKAAAMRSVLGVPEAAIEPTLNDLRRWGGLTPGAPVSDITSLFPRIEQKQPAATTAAAHPQPANKGGVAANSVETGVADMASIDDFAKIRLMTARIIAAEKVPKADKLVRLDVEVGAEKRQIVAGIAQHYTADSLIGMVIVIVANLKPVKIRGLESNGMLLAATDGKALRLVKVDGDCASGASIG